MNRIELTYDEFTRLPLQYMLGVTGDFGAHRVYRNDEVGVQKETITRRERPGDIYGGWKEPQVSFFLDGDPREFRNAAECYEAYMALVCKEAA